MKDRISTVREKIRKSEARLREEEEYLKALRARQRQLEDEEIISTIRGMMEKGRDVRDVLSYVQSVQAIDAPEKEKEKEDMEHA